MFDKQQIKTWLTEGIKADTVIKAEEWGKKLALPFQGDFNKNKKEGLTQTQIRNVFGELRRIQMNGYIKSSDGKEVLKEISSFILLKPKFAYLSKRHDKEGVDLFYQFFSASYDALELNSNQLEKSKFENFMNLMEAVLAYHKFYSIGE